jgi:hypothetical protein
MLLLLLLLLEGGTLLQGPYLGQFGGRVSLSNDLVEWDAHCRSDGLSSRPEEHSRGVGRRSELVSV